MRAVGHATTSRPGSRRRAVSSGMWWATVAAAAALGGLSLLDVAGRAPGPPLLRASFVGAAAAPEVRLEAAVAPPGPAPVPAPAPKRPRARAVDVPADPYAPEPIVELGTIEIPRLGVRQRLMQGVTLRNIDLGPSHWPGTAMAGEPGNMVVAGHRVTNSRPFRNIDQLEAGDQIHVTTRGQQATYQVASKFVVTPDRTDIADPTDTPMLTMFACHPPGSARLRYVVRADLVAASAV